jgi:hypothetical protein
METSLITLSTDFGLTDPYVGIMKGVILSVNPEARIVDLTHGIPSHDILAGALALRSAYGYFPPGTVHVVVVDPGVGSRRRPILVATENYRFLGPDNGVLSFVLQLEKGQIFHLTETRYFCKTVSQTFHGRDIFAPVAAHLSLGTAAEAFGEPVQDPVVVEWPEPRRLGERKILGRILRIDRFGNLITNVTQQDLTNLGTFSKLVIQIGGHQIARLCRSYAEAKPGEPFAIFGSAGLLEISVNQASAEQLLGVQSQTEFELEIR